MYPGIVQQENLADTEEQLRRVLFGKGQEGVWFDPSDKKTLFSSSTGRQAVFSSGDYVGFILDKHSQHSWRQLSEIDYIEGLPPGGGTITYPVTSNIQEGQYYLIYATVTNYQGYGDLGMAGSGAFLNEGSLFTASGRINGNGEIRVFVQAPSSGEFLLFTRTTNSCNFENIKVYEVTGNHAVAQVTNHFVFRETVEGHCYIEYPPSTSVDYAFTYTGVTYPPAESQSQFGVMQTYAQGSSQFQCLSSALVPGSRYVGILREGDVSTVVVNANLSPVYPYRVNGQAGPETRNSIWEKLSSSPGVTGQVNFDLSSYAGQQIYLSGFYRGASTSVENFNGCDFYGFIEWSGNATLGVAQKVEQYLANKAGITLP